MRVVQLVKRRQRRGAETFAAQLADGLAYRGCDVTFLGLFDPPDEPLVPHQAAYDDIGRAKPLPLNPRLIGRLAGRLSELQPDLVQANGSDTLKYGVFARLAGGASWPLVYRNISIGSHWLRYPGHRHWVKWLLHQADFTAAVSERARIDLERTFELPANKVRTIPIGTEIPDDPQRAAMRHLLVDELGLPARVEILIHVGSFSPEKNHLWLIECFESIAEARPNAHLVLVGDGSLRSVVADAIRERGLSGRVHLLGSRSNAASLMAGADLLVMTSLIEGIPGVILEAAARGTPCVSTDVGSVGEAIDSGTTGVLVPSGDREGFVAAVVSLLGEPDRVAALGSAAREFVIQRFAMRSIVDSFASLYEELLTARGGTNRLRKAATEFERAAGPSSGRR